MLLHLDPLLLRLALGSNADGPETDLKIIFLKCIFFHLGNLEVFPTFGYNGSWKFWNRTPTFRCCEFHFLTTNPSGSSRKRSAVPR